MIALDTSALVAILLGEPEAETFARTIAATRETYVCAATTVEAGIVVETRLGPLGGRELDLLLVEARDGPSSRSRRPEPRSRATPTGSTARAGTPRA